MVAFGWSLRGCGPYLAITPSSADFSAVPDSACLGANNLVIGHIYPTSEALEVVRCRKACLQTCLLSAEHDLQLASSSDGLGRACRAWLLEVDCSHQVLLCPWVAFVLKTGLVACTFPLVLLVVHLFQVVAVVSWHQSPCLWPQLMIGFVVFCRPIYFIA